VTTDILDFLNNQRSFRLGADMIQQLSDVGQMTAGENVLVDKTAYEVSNKRT
jgi:hypothetical protein